MNTEFDGLIKVYKMLNKELELLENSKPKFDGSTQSLIEISDFQGREYALQNLKLKLKSMIMEAVQ